MAWTGVFGGCDFAAVVLRPAWKTFLGYTTNYILFDTNVVTAAVHAAFTSDVYSDAFSQGLILGVTVVVGCLVFSMLRTITGENHEDM